MLGHSCTAGFTVEETLFGSVPANKTLLITFRESSLLIPEVYSKTDPPVKGSRWIVFLTDQGLKQLDNTNYWTRAVGPSEYSHDGFELAKDETLKQVRELITRKKQK